MAPEQDVSVLDVVAMADSIDTRLKSQTKYRIIERTRPFIHGLEQFERALSTYANGSALVMAPLWGSTQILLAVSLYPFWFMYSLVFGISHLIALTYVSYKYSLQQTLWMHLTKSLTCFKTLQRSCLASNGTLRCSKAVRCSKPLYHCCTRISRTVSRRPSIFFAEEVGCAARDYCDPPSRFAADT